MEDSQQRSDKGVSRAKYKSIIHPKYKSFLMKCNRYEVESPYTEQEYLQIVQNPCYYCGGNYKIGLTRIDINDDFNLDNVRACCYKCSLFKFGDGEREFLSKIMSIAKYQQNR
jgi:hypothetical protein